jgi:PQQ-dependent catabolism-associated CXXCW motif protein
MIRLRLLSLILLMAFPVGAAEEPTGYRESEYRAEVPATLAGATVVSTEAAHALWKTGRVAFIDVLPRTPKPENLPAGTIWKEKPRMSVPAALWLPNVGYGRLADVMQGYFRAGLEKATSASMAAGCPGMPPSAPWNMAIPTSSGIRREPMAGQLPVIQRNASTRSRAGNDMDHGRAAGSRT